MYWLENEDGEVKPKRGVIVLCYCPDWSDIGYQVAKWNGKEFYYEDQPNETFGSYVVSWAGFMEAD